MEPDFDKQFRDKMEEASIHDIMPGYDKEGDWRKILKRLTPASRPAMWLWVSHAAAIAAGVIIGLFFLKHIVAGKPDYRQVVATTAPKAAPKQIIIRDTIYRQVYTSIAEKVQPSRLNHIEKLQKITTPQMPDNNNEVVQPQKEEVAVVTHTHRIRAVNLLDIENEDKATFLSNQPTQQSPKGIMTHISDYLAPGTASPANEVAVKDIFTKNYKK